MAYKNPEDQKAYNKAWYAAHREEIKARSKARRAANPERHLEYGKRYHTENRELKRALMRMFGDCCAHCGYEGSVAAFDFHHVDPVTKEFQTCTSRFFRVSLTVLLEELEKCILLCSNCHRELHWPDPLL